MYGSILEPVLADHNLLGWSEQSQWRPS